jgi:hypothetical protein
MMLNPTIFVPRPKPVRPPTPPPVLPEETGEPVLELKPDGRLWYGRGKLARAVTVRRCFPWSEPGRFISLRDEDNAEVALVADPAELDPASRQSLENALAAAGFVLEVTRVAAVKEEIEIRHWTVETLQGPRTFQTRLDDWPRALPGGGVLIRDVAGDLYLVAQPDRLDRQSRELLWAFVD